MSDTQNTVFGFSWGPALVERVAAYEHTGGTYRVLRVHTEYGQLDIYISPAGRSLRVFRRGDELTTARDDRPR